MLENCTYIFHEVVRKPNFSLSSANLIIAVCSIIDHTSHDTTLSVCLLFQCLQAHCADSLQGGDLNIIHYAHLMIAVIYFYNDILYIHFIYILDCWCCVPYEQFMNVNVMAIHHIHFNCGFPGDTKVILGLELIE